MSTPLERIVNNEKVDIRESYDNKRTDIEELVEDIKELILDKKLVPVICEDMFEYINPATGERQSLQSFIVEHIITEEPLPVKYTETEIQYMLTQGYSGMRLLYRKYGRKLFEHVYNCVYDRNRNVREGITLKSEVIEFLKKGKFPLIITTNCFKIIEKILGEYTTMEYKPNSGNDETIVGNCVFHIMGESKRSYPCGIEEHQILKILNGLYSTDHEPKNLKTYLENNQDRRTLFILGNNTPDWLFRFILFRMFSTDLYDEGNGFYLNDKKTKDEHLEKFLEDISFREETEMFKVLEEVTSRLPSTSSPQIEIIGHNKKWDFFLSYASENKAYAVQLKEILESHGLKVWYDNKDIIDGSYWQSIIDGIENSAIFLPLISASYIKKVLLKDERTQVLQKYEIETLPHDPRMCLQINKDKKIINKDKEIVDITGVQIELLLAESQFSNQDVPAIPVILSNEVLQNKIMEIEVTAENIEKMAAGSRCLPEKLFGGIQMYGFDKNNPSSFVLNWERYKGNK